MSLVVLTGGARCGKSAAAECLAAASTGRVVVAVGGRVLDDPEMVRRVERHLADRPGRFETLEIDDVVAFGAALPTGCCLVVECLGTMVSSLMEALAVGQDARIPLGADVFADGRYERDAADAVDALVEALVARVEDTVVVTNEVGSGIVPVHPSARLFRDVLGRANRRLVDAADAAYLVVAGRCVDLRALPAEPAWPSASPEEST
ncbi:MAG: bifunctional adenosylcobinamide kinase/adenosylcobinamide-phosphate guanylyltransferase [Coriobacteriia bacterium]